jgi:hypothetical protein
MFEFIVGIWPGVAMLIMAGLAFAVTVKKPPKSKQVPWFVAFGIVGISAIAATVGYQVMLAQERREAESRQQQRDGTIKELQGKVDALLTTLPGGSKQAAGEGTWMQLSEDQKQVLIDALSTEGRANPTWPGCNVEIVYSGGSTRRTFTDLKAVFEAKDVHWFVTENLPGTPLPTGLTVIGRFEASKAHFLGNLKRFGYDKSIHWVDLNSMLPCHWQIIIGESP